MNRSTLFILLAFPLAMAPLVAGGDDRPEIKNRIGVHSEAVTATNCGRLGQQIPTH